MAMIDRFRDRTEAGRLLTQRLAPYANRSDVLVAALPRGGVPVAFEIARSLRAPLDVFLVRKLGVPNHEELAMGAIAIGGVEIVDPEIVEAFHLSRADVERVASAEREELQRRERAYRGERRPLDVLGRTVIVVDDGIATGSTMRAAIAALRKLGPARIVVAAGVAPLSTSLLLNAEADEVVCLLTPREFRAVALFYDDFPQLSDADVRDYLERAGRHLAPATA